MQRRMKTDKGTEIFRLVPARCNVLIVRGKGGAIMVDTGMPSDRFLLRRALIEPDLRPKAIVLTHSHFDHAANAAWLKREYGMKVIVHSSEAENLSMGNTPIPAGTLNFTRWLVSVGRRLPSWFTYEPCVPDLAAGDVEDMADFGINGHIIHIPGHCKGEIALIIDDEVALCGDSIIGMIPGKIFPPFADDAIQTVESWRKLLETQCNLFIPGHGRPVRRDILEREYLKRTGG